MKAAPFFKLASKQQNKILHHYQNQVHQQQVLLGILKSALPEALKEYASYCVVTNNKAFIYTRSAVWASQLRFYTSAMLEASKKRTDYACLDNLQIRILSLMPTSQTRPCNLNTPSAAAIKCIRETRNHERDILSDALIALSNTLDKYRQKS